MPLWQPLMIICPASIRILWCEELEKWLPTLRPCEITVVQGNADWHPTKLNESLSQRKDGSSSPTVVVISYHMLANLSCAQCKQPASTSKGRVCPGFPFCIAAGRFPFVIVDESHHMRTTNGRADTAQTEAAKLVVRNARRAVLLSGTPSVTRPFDLVGQIYSLQSGRLGTNYEKFKTSFAFRYCQRRLVPVRSRGGSPSARTWKQGGGERLQELAAVLRADFMIRRLKIDVLPQLPSKRRQIIHLERPSIADFASAEAYAWQV
jgi:SNF2 family DNA or RNA helicase